MLALSSYSTIWVSSGLILTLIVCENFGMSQVCDRNAFQEQPPCISNKQYTHVQELSKCLRLVSGKRKYLELKTECNSDGGFIMRIDNKDEEDGIDDVMVSEFNITDEDTWLGLRFNSTVNGWTWENARSNRIGYSNWEGTPVSTTTNRCAAKLARSAGWKLIDCNERRRGLCEIPSTRKPLVTSLMLATTMITVGHMLVMECTFFDPYESDYVYFKFVDFMGNVSSHSVMDIGSSTESESFVPVNGICRRITVVNTIVRAAVHWTKLSCCTDLEDAPHDINSWDRCSSNRSIQVTHQASKANLTMLSGDEPVQFIGSILVVSCTGLLDEEVRMTLAIEDHLGLYSVWQASPREGFISAPALEGLTLRYSKITINEYSNVQFTIEMGLGPLSSNHDGWTIWCFTKVVGQEQLHTSWAQDYGMKSKPIQMRHSPSALSLRVHYHNPPATIISGKFLRIECELLMSIAELVIWKIDIHEGPSFKFTVNVNNSAIEKPEGMSNVSITYNKEYIDIESGYNVTTTLKLLANTHLHQSVVQCLPDHRYGWTHSQSVRLSVLFELSPPILVEDTHAHNYISGGQIVHAHLECSAAVGTNGVLTWALFLKPDYAFGRYWRVDFNTRQIKHKEDEFSIAFEIEYSFEDSQSKGPIVKSGLEVLVEGVLHEAIVLCCSYNFTARDNLDLLNPEDDDPLCDMAIFPPYSGQSRTTVGKVLEKLGFYKFAFGVTLLLLVVVLMVACALVTFYPKEKPEITYEDYDGDYDPNFYYPDPESTSRSGGSSYSSGSRTSSSGPFSDSEISSFETGETTV